MTIDIKDIDRLIAELERQINDTRKTIDALVALTRNDYKPKPVRLIDPRTGKEW